VNTLLRRDSATRKSPTIFSNNGPSLMRKVAQVAAETELAAARAQLDLTVGTLK